MAEPEAHRDPLAMQQFFAEYGVTTTHFVPSMLAAFVASLTPQTARQNCSTLKQVFCSGEALPADLCREWQQLTGAPLHNLYGPTEAAVDVSWYPAFGEELAEVRGSSVPIGYPVWNTGLRILDAMMHPVPPGVAGDLYLTGIQLAQGYLGRPDLTASRFIADPFAPGERMYRTGDVARWLDNGAVEYLGRSDDQLKIRGQRIELGEIDRVMQALPDVEQAVTHACVINQAAATGGDARQLVGYLVSQSGLPLDTSALQAQLRETLPPHMVPVVLLQLPQLPLSANGKLDRKALPLPELKAQTPGRVPKAGSETIIAAAFSSLLGCDVQDADADFFALGGHSLLAMKLAAQLSRQFARQVTPGQVMVASTVAKLATIIDGEEDSTQRMGFETILPLREGNGPTLFCFHPASGFPGSSACSRVISIHNGRLSAFSRRALMAPCRRRQTWMKSAKRIWQPYLNNNRTAHITCWVIHLAVRWRRALRRDCVPVANRWHFLACWIPGRQKRKTGRKKKPMVWIRKCWRRLTASAKPSWRHSREVLQRSCLPPLKATTLMLCAC